MDKTQKVLGALFGAAATVLALVYLSDAYIYQFTEFIYQYYNQAPFIYDNGKLYLNAFGKTLFALGLFTGIIGSLSINYAANYFLERLWTSQ